MRLTKASLFAILAILAVAIAGCGETRQESSAEASSENVFENAKWRHKDSMSFLYAINGNVQLKKCATLTEFVKKVQCQYHPMRSYAGSGSSYVGCDEGYDGHFEEAESTFGHTDFMGGLIADRGSGWDLMDPALVYLGADWDENRDVLKPLSGVAGDQVCSEYWLGGLDTRDAWKVLVNYTRTREDAFTIRAESHKSRRHSYPLHQHHLDAFEKHILIVTALLGRDMGYQYGVFDQTDEDLSHTARETTVTTTTTGEAKTYETPSFGVSSAVGSGVMSYTSPSSGVTFPDCCRNRKVRYYPDQAGSRFREKSVIPAKAGIQGFS